jgi:catechol 2,3-dioxygenase-like lactoylglutathione lyase family enzyme
MEFRRIDHIQLAMPAGQEDKARHFFSELLEMPEIEKPGILAARGGCWFQAKGVIIHLGVDRDFKPAAKAHPAFCVSDVDGLAERLSAAGCVVEWDDALPNRRRFYTKDPFENRMEFIQDGHGFTQR